MRQKTARVETKRKCLCAWSPITWVSAVDLKEVTLSQKAVELANRLNYYDRLHMCKELDTAMTPSEASDMVSQYHTFDPDPFRDGGFEGVAFSLSSDGAADCKPGQAVITFWR